MTPHWTRKRHRTYRYYTCRAAQDHGHATCPTKSVNAGRVEQFVVDQIQRIGADPQLQDETFRQAVAQVKAQRRGLKAEKRRIERDLVTVRADVQRLVETVSRVSGQAAEAVAAQLEAAQTRLATLENRQGEVEVELASLKTQVVEREDLTQALAEFTPIWDVLLTPERERVLNLLVEKITYNGATQVLAIDWRLAGFGQLATETRS
jgi:site-specific DNA recombinase